MNVRTYIVRVDFPSGRQNYYVEEADEEAARKRIEQHLNDTLRPPVGIAEVVPA